MKQMRRIFLLAALAACGCKGSETALRVDVRAEPKQGYKPPVVSAYGGSAHSDDEGHDHAYHLIDYDHLRDVVVYAEPTGSTQIAPAAELKPVEIKLAPATGTVYATGVGGRVVLRNIGRAPQTVVLRGPGDAFADFQVAAAAQVEHVVTKPGLVEVIRDEDADPIANLYVAPTPLVRVARAGEPVTFAPLAPGGYTVTAWHPILPGSTTTATVAEGQTATVKLTVGVNALPKAK